jgi:monoamine oxidase
VAAAADGLERVFPGSRSRLTGSFTVAWAAEPYSGGTYSAFAPGQLTRFWRALRSPVGRLHFAGEHTEALAGYMESAIRSGKRVAAALRARG